jgi:hypothetical protein
MKKLVGICTILLISGVVAFAQNSKPKPLSDKQMDSITAGNSGGHDDDGGDNKNGGTATVAISGGALSGVTAVNLVVAADSTVVSGINVFSGNSSSSSNAPTPAPAKKGGSDDKGGDDKGGNKTGITQSNDIYVDHTSKSASNSSVTVSDNAESGVTATNLVNAASSVVVSGLNVAQTNTLSTSSFTQSNKISVMH